MSEEPKRKVGRPRKVPEVEDPPGTLNPDRILEDIPEEIILKFLASKSKTETESKIEGSNESYHTPLTPVEKFYLDRKSIGTLKRCSTCGQGLVSEEEAIKIYGGEN